MEVYYVLICFIVIICFCFISFRSRQNTSDSSDVKKSFSITFEPDIMKKEWFDSDIHEYDIEMPQTLETVTISLKTQNSDVSFFLNDIPFENNSSRELHLNFGLNILIVTVEQDLIRKKYTFKINRSTDFLWSLPKYITHIDNCRSCKYVSNDNNESLVLFQTNNTFSYMIFNDTESWSEHRSLESGIQLSDQFISGNYILEYSEMNKEFLLVWLDNQGITCCSFKNNRWSSPATVCQPQHKIKNDFHVIAGNGTCIIAWSELTGNDTCNFYYSSLLDQWSPKKLIGENISGTYTLTNLSGIFFVWSSSDDSLLYSSTLTDGILTEPVSLCTVNSAPLRFSHAVNDKGGFLLVFTGNEQLLYTNTTYYIYYDTENGWGELSAYQHTPEISTRVFENLQLSSPKVIHTINNEFTIISPVLTDFGVQSFGVPVLISINYNPDYDRTSVRSVDPGENVYQTYVSETELIYLDPADQEEIAVWNRKTFFDEGSTLFTSSSRFNTWSEPKELSNGYGVYQCLGINRIQPDEYTHKLHLMYLFRFNENDKTMYLGEMFYE